MGFGVRDPKTSLISNKKPAQEGAGFLLEESKVLWGHGPHTP
jgi:hypothetical protein